MRQRFDLVEVLVVAVVLVLVTLVVDRSLRTDEDALLLGAMSATELQPLRERFGPDHYSRNAEEWIIRDFFNDRRDGVFLDVGSHHYRDENNSYYLETELGWSGIAIDAQEEFAPDYAAHRPRTTFLARFVSDVSDSTAQLFVPTTETLVASDTAAFAEHEAGETGDARSVPTITLNDVLDHAGITRLDFLSMDIELAEPRALAGFDIERFRPALVCIEGHRAVRQQILDYFHEHGYVLVGDYLRVDHLNLYFKPAA